MENNKIFWKFHVKNNNLTHLTVKGASLMHYYVKNFVVNSKGNANVSIILLGNAC